MSVGIIQEHTNIQYICTVHRLVYTVAYCKGYNGVLTLPAEVIYFGPKLNDLTTLRALKTFLELL